MGLSVHVDVPTWVYRLGECIVKQTLIETLEGKMVARYLGS